MRTARSLLAAAVLAAGGTIAPLPFVAPAAVAQDQSVRPLAVGDQAPALVDVDWLKGPASSSFEAGTVYVLDFWATWCGPCIRAMPHLKDLQETYAEDDVEFIGVAIWPRNGQVPTSEWIANPPEMVGEVTWAVAEDIDGKTAATYMRGLGQGGIPTVVIVDRQGTIAWVGHPMSMDDALEGIVEGTYSVAERQRADQLITDARAAAGLGDWELAVELMDQVIEADPSWAIQLGLNKYTMIRDRIGDAERARRAGREFIDGPASDDAEALNAFAWQIAAPEVDLPEEAHHLDLASEAAERAATLTERRNADILDTLAHVRYHEKRFDDAIKVQNEAIELTSNPRQREAYERTRDMFERAKAQHNDEG